MANCEFRRVRDNSMGIAVEGVGEMGVAVGRRGIRVPVCLVKASSLKADAIEPECDLPNTSTEDCPIAQFEKRNLSLPETNQQLTIIFDARRSSKVAQGII